MEFDAVLQQGEGILVPVQTGCFGKLLKAQESHVNENTDTGRR